MNVVELPASYCKTTSLITYSSLLPNTECRYAIHQVTAWWGILPYLQYTALRGWHFSGFPTEITAMTTDSQS
uniref:Uncharacterized protein n=1 Tax=Anguilla anguilla TaxID=7936 RepID=A0A0E9R8H9_ANGAN